MKILKKIGVILLVVFLVAQFFSPEKNNGSVDTVNGFIAETNPPEKVVSILKNTCFDCHSSTTRYPWYNSITPVNYWLAEHINDGKKHLDFSVWSTYSLKKKEHKMDELVEEVLEKEMPLDSYTWTHKDAILSDEEIKVVTSWATKVQENYKAQITVQK